MGLLSSFKSSNKDQQPNSNVLRRKSLTSSRRSSNYDDGQLSPQDRRSSVVPSLPPVSNLAYRRDSVDMQQNPQYGAPAPPQRQQEIYSPVSPPSSSPSYGSAPPRNQFEQAQQPRGRPMSYAGPPGGQQQPQGGFQQGHQHSISQGGQAGYHAPPSRSQSNHSLATSQQNSFQSPPARQQTSSPNFNDAAAARGPSAAPARRSSTHSSTGAQSLQKPPSTIAGEPLHDLGRAIGLLKSSKFYAEGFLMKKVEVGSDGKAHPGSADGEWAKWFVQLSGTIMSTWNAAEMDEAARNNRTVPPQYLNLSDAFLHPYPPNANSNAPTSFQFALNSAGLNRLLFCAPSLQSLTMWINAIRLAGWERSRCNEIYTGTLLGQREPPQGWLGYEGGLSGPGGAKGKFEGWLKIRLPGDTEWRRMWTVVLRGSGAGGPKVDTSKKAKRTSLLSFGKKADTPAVIDELPGDGNFSTIAFYSEKPTKKEQPLCIAQHIFYAAAIYPESEKLINKSSLFKIEGTFLNPNDSYKMGWGVGGRAEKQGYALLMLEEGDYLGMLEWIVGLADAFKLYGRPTRFSFDPRDPSSMYFALPVGPHRDRQFLDRELVDNLDINESRPRAIRAVFHNILFDRMRGVRPAALGPGDGSRSGSPATRAPNSAPPPQLAPLDTSGTLKVQNGDNYDDNDADPPRRYQSRNDSPKLSLPPIGEGSVDPDGPDQASAKRDLEREQWERQQRERLQGEEAERREQAEREQRRLQLQREQQERERLERDRQQQQERQERERQLEQEREREREQQNRERQWSQQSQTAQEGSRSTGHGPTLVAVSNSRPESSQAQYDGDRRTSSNGEHLSNYTAFLSSDLSREPTPPPPSSTARAVGASPVINSGVTSSVDQSQNASSGGNFSRSSDGSAGGQQSQSHFATPAVAAAAGAASAAYLANRHEQGQNVPSSSERRSLPLPGAASSNVGVPSQAGSEVGLAYLHSDVGQSTPQPQQIAVEPEPVLEKKVDPAPVHQQFGERSALEESATAREAAPTSQSNVEQRLPTPVDNVQAYDQSGQASPTRPLFSPPKAHQASFSGSGDLAIQSPHSGNTASPNGASQELTPQPNGHGNSPLIPPKSPGRDRRPSPVIDTASLPQQSSSPRTAPQQQANLSPPIPAPAAFSPQSDASSFDQHGARSEHASPEDYNIHSDLLAALHFADRGESPPPITPNTISSTEPSPIAPQGATFHVGPPKRGLFDPSSDVLYGRRPSGTAVEVLADEPSHQSQERSIPIPPIPASADPAPAPPVPTPAAPSSFPSSFAPNKRAEERAAAAKLAEAAQQAALTRPGRAPGAGANKGKQRAWVDSDEDEEEQEEEEDSDDDAQVAPASRPLPPSSSSQQDLSSRNSLQVGPRPIPGMSPQEARRSYYEHGPSPENRISPLPSPSNASPYNASPLPSSPSRGDFRQLREESPARQPGLKPVVSPHGLLHAGIIDKEERSARALESQARDSGGPLVSLPSKPPPPQTGLVGAITSHQREKERTGGVGRALTEQQRERKLAEQRQKQLDELQRQQLAQQQAFMQQQSMMQAAQFGGYGSMGPMGMPGMGTMGTMGGYGHNPWMMQGGGGFGAFPQMGPGSQMGMPPSSPSQVPQNVAQSVAGGRSISPTPGGLDLQQQQMQQQQQMYAAQQAAQAAAQAAYMQAMANFPSAGSPAGSPAQLPMNFSQAPFYPTSPSFMQPQFGVTPSMYGYNPYQQQFGGSQLGHGQQPSFGGQEAAGEQADGDVEGERRQTSTGAQGRASPFTLPPQGGDE